MLAFRAALQGGTKFTRANTRQTCNIPARRFTMAAKVSSSRTHLTSAVAAEVDKRLMDPDGVGYKLEQLMELAGLGVASCVADVAEREGLQRDSSLVVVVCGPGNNGGDGLVAARHLSLMGFTKVNCLVPVNKFPSLTKQLGAFDIPFVDSIAPHAALVVDAVFGFSFRPPLRGPFPAVLEQMNQSAALLVSVDMPSGWDVDTGERCEGAVREPNALISLTAPKLGSLALQNALHYCSGKFVPPALASEMGLTLPIYPAVHSQFVILD